MSAGLILCLGGMKMRRTKDHDSGSLGAVFSRALISITVSIINYWGKSGKQKRR